MLRADDSTDICVERICKHIKCLEGIRHPNTGPRALNAAADYIRDQLEVSGIEVCERPFTVCGFSYPFRNVEGVINPKCGKEWVISAHYDTVCNSPGADDNASGVAAMLEAARVLAKSGTKRTIRFIGFSLEEGSPVEGDCTRFLGSRAWVNCMKERGINVAGVVNLESVGYVGTPQGYPSGFDPECFPRYGVDDLKCGNFIAILSNEESTELGNHCFKQCSSTVVKLPAILVNFKMLQQLDPEPDAQPQDKYSYIMRADHVPFWDNRIPAITLTDTAFLRTPHYHTDQDKSERLTMEFVRKVCLATVLTVEPSALASRQSGTQTGHGVKPKHV